ncbi:MAG: hypothetical protein AB7F22_05380 [Reyranella sp.]|uniref:hypothetical protein n=1 Tax=Reyranella sp. TaxID=1929291 RepID=UPI003D13044F
MSATLTWASSGAGTKTGTTVAALIADLVTLINSKSGDASFSWEVASSNTASSPNYLVLKRKDGSAGRILLVVWTSSPAGNNAAILDGAPSLNSLYGAWFPSGNVDTPSNLTASSGTILGNDSGCTKVWASMTVASIYGTSGRPFYFDSAEGVLFCFQNPATPNCYMGGAGDLVVDSADNAQAAVIGYGASTLAGFGGTSAIMAWSATKPSATSSTACVRTNYGAADRVYFSAWTPGGAWASSAVSSTDILTDTANSKAWFVPVQLLGQTKGEGFVLKLRQIGFGPGTKGPLTPYNTTGPTVQARQINLATTGGTGFPWAVNFKL